VSSTSTNTNSVHEFVVFVFSICNPQTRTLNCKTMQSRECRQTDSEHSTEITRLLLLLLLPAWYDVPCVMRERSVTARAGSPDTADRLIKMSGGGSAVTPKGCESLFLPLSSRRGLLEVVEVAGELVVRDAELGAVPLDVRGPADDGLLQPTKRLNA